MSVNNISASNLMCVCSSPDFEAIEIARRLKAYGIEPTGDKYANKAKLHEIELQKVKQNNEPTGNFLTIDYNKEQEIINKKKENQYGSLKNYKKEKGNKDTLREDEILGQQILAIIELKKREEKDKENSKRINPTNNEKQVKLKKTQNLRNQTIQSQICPNINPDIKETHNINVAEN